MNHLTKDIQAASVGVGTEQDKNAYESNDHAPPCEGREHVNERCEQLQAEAHLAIVQYLILTDKMGKENGISPWKKYLLNHFALLQHFMNGGLIEEDPKTLDFDHFEVPPKLFLNFQNNEHLMALFGQCENMRKEEIISELAKKGVFFKDSELELWNTAQRLIWTAMMANGKFKVENSDPETLLIEKIPQLAECFEKLIKHAADYNSKKSAGDSPQTEGPYPTTCPDYLMDPNPLLREQLMIRQSFALAPWPFVVDIPLYHRH